jgi:4-hydroxymandelate oxidase
MNLSRRNALHRLGGFLAGSPFVLYAQQRAPELRDRIPGINEIANVLDFEPIARRNRQAFDWASIVPRAVADVSSMDLSTELFGIKMAAPIVVAPTAGHAQLHADGEKATHQGATAAGALMSVSSNSSFPIDEVAKAATGPLWFQLYAGETPDLTRDRVERALQAGCQAVCFTVDVQYSSHRERILHDRNLSIAPPGPLVRRTRGTPPPPIPYRLRGQNPGNTWQTVEAIRAYTKVPLLLKGILTAEDAKLAVERGANGIVVSNHGGRYLDYAPATFEVLAEIVDAVGGRIPVLMDGGVRRGTDVFKALALGAKAVQVGRPPLWGLGAFGAAGVQRVLEILQTELALAMASAGQSSIAAIKRSSVTVDFP